MFGLNTMSEEINKNNLHFWHWLVWVLFRQTLSIVFQVYFRQKKSCDKRKELPWPCCETCCAVVIKKCFPNSQRGKTLDHIYRLWFLVVSHDKAIGLPHPPTASLYLRSEASSLKRQTFLAHPYSVFSTPHPPLSVYCFLGYGSGGALAALVVNLCGSSPVSLI